MNTYYKFTFMKNYIFVFFVGFTFLFSCSSQRGSVHSKLLSLQDSLNILSDSIRVKGITIHNLFKCQILAHRKVGKFDSSMILQNVYLPHKQLWNSCYGIIFGSDNASKFNHSIGMVKWNKTLYPENKAHCDLSILG